jgi:hypothetical protein
MKLGIIAASLRPAEFIQKSYIPKQKVPHQSKSEICSCCQID